MKVIGEGANGQYICILSEAEVEYLLERRHELRQRRSLDDLEDSPIEPLQGSRLVPASASNHEPVPELDDDPYLYWTSASSPRAQPAPRPAKAGSRKPAASKPLKAAPKRSTPAQQPKTQKFEEARSKSAPSAPKAMNTTAHADVPDVGDTYAPPEDPYKYMIGKHSPSRAAKSTRGARGVPPPAKTSRTNFRR